MNQTLHDQDMCREELRDFLIETYSEFDGVIGEETTAHAINRWAESKGYNLKAIHAQTILRAVTEAADAYYRATAPQSQGDIAREQVAEGQRRILGAQIATLTGPPDAISPTPAFATQVPPDHNGRRVDNRPAKDQQAWPLGINPPADAAAASLGLNHWSCWSTGSGHALWIRRDGKVTEIPGDLDWTAVLCALEMVDQEQAQGPPALIERTRMGVRVNHRPAGLGFRDGRLQWEADSPRFRGFLRGSSHVTLFLIENGVDGRIRLFGAFLADVEEPLAFPSLHLAQRAAEAVLNDWVATNTKGWL